jgi:hypothetical protein
MCIFVTQEAFVKGAAGRGTICHGFVGGFWIKVSQMMEGNHAERLSGQTL